MPSEKLHTQRGLGIRNVCRGDEIIQYLMENYMNNLSNKQIAGRFHYHPEHISRIVCAYTGMTLKQYIIGLRIRAALDMLVQTNMDMESIACKVGYDNLQYFYRIFKNRTGFSPGYFRHNII